MIKLKDLVYVFGHRNPDTDSIVSAIAYAKFKQSMGINAVACRLGALNDETTYLLNRFNVSQPQLLKDARATVEEIEMDKAYTISLDTTIREAMDILSEINHQTLAVVNEKNQLLGIVTSSDLSSIAMGDTANNIAMLSRTSLENIAKTVDGHIVYAPDNFHNNGKVSIVAIASTRLAHYELKDRMIIIGNDVKAQIEAIEKGASAIIAVWTADIDPQVIEKAKEHSCAIIISSHGTLNTSRFIFFSASVKEIMIKDVVLFNKNEYVEDVGKVMLETRYRTYPVIDEQNKVFGFISRFHVLNSRSKRLILVDHNEYSQSVDGVENAEILEVIDHHHIGDINTSKPISFRNEIIGSTASIITKIYQEHNVEIEENIAGLLLSALISDTLNLRSPTTTPQDFVIADYLSKVAKLDRNSLAKDIFKITSSLKNKSYDDIINQDIKSFDISGQNVMVSQIVLYEFDQIKEIADEFKAYMEKFIKVETDLLVVVFTSISNNGSIILAAGKLKDVVKKAFYKKDDEEFAFLSEIVSRKKQIIPRLSVAIEQNSKY